MRVCLQLPSLYVPDFDGTVLRHKGARLCVVDGCRRFLSGPGSVIRAGRAVRQVNDANPIRKLSCESRIEFQHLRLQFREPDTNENILSVETSNGMYALSTDSDRVGFEVIDHNRRATWKCDACGIT